MLAVRRTAFPRAPVLAPARGHRQRRRRRRIRGHRQRRRRRRIRRRRRRRRRRRWRRRRVAGMFDGDNADATCAIDPGILLAPEAAGGPDKGYARPIRDRSAVHGRHRRHRRGVRLAVASPTAQSEAAIACPGLTAALFVGEALEFRADGDSIHHPARADAHFVGVLAGPRTLGAVAPNPGFRSPGRRTRPRPSTAAATAATAVAAAPMAAAMAAAASAATAATAAASAAKAAAAAATALATSTAAAAAATTAAAATARAAATAAATTAAAVARSASRCTSYSCSRRCSCPPS